MDFHLFQPSFLFFFELTGLIFLGLVLGSFSSALIYRVPRDIRWGLMAKRSHCPHCQKKLTVKNLIPVFSWVIQGGKCTFCQSSISCKYPVSELLSLIMVVGVWIFYGTTPQTFLIAALVPVLVALLFIDLEFMMLPNILIVSAALIGVVYHVFNLSAGAYELSFFFLNFLGAALFYPFFIYLVSFWVRKLLKKETLGLGDVKFFAVAGLWLGFYALPWFCVLAGLFGVFMGLFWRYFRQSQIFPFGPALIISFYILLLPPSQQFFLKSLLSV